MSLDELKQADLLDMAERYDSSQAAFLNIVDILRGCQKELVGGLIIEPGKIQLQSTHDMSYLLKIRLMPSLFYVFQLLSDKNTASLIYSKCKEMFRHKNVDYGNAFVDFGVIGVLSRINEKLSRAITLQLAENKQEASLVDTLLDTVNYVIMADIILGE